MNRRFIEFHNDGKYIKFISQYDYVPRDGIGFTEYKIECVNGKSPIELLKFKEDNAKFKVLIDFRFNEPNNIDLILKKDEIYSIKPSGDINKIN